MLLIFLVSLSKTAGKIIVGPLIRASPLIDTATNFPLIRYSRVSSKYGGKWRYVGFFYFHCSKFSIFPLCSLLRKCFSEMWPGTDTDWQCWERSRHLHSQQLPATSVKFPGRRHENNLSKQMLMCNAYLIPVGWYLNTQF